MAETTSIPSQDTGVISTGQDTRLCPYCAEAILPAAKKCKHCGEILDPILLKAAAATEERKEEEIKWNPGIAALMSLLLPGAGQMYKTQVGQGLAWLIITILGYVCFIVPGAFFHLFCIINAATEDPNKSKRRRK